MRITDVKALILRQPRLDASVADGSQDALLIEVHTDEGLIGLGEVDSSPTVIKAIVDAPASHSVACGLRSLLVGEDPTQISRLWERMFKGTLYFGRRGAAIHAISGVDIALWDLLGKATGKPVWALLGGRHRESVRAYASTLMPEHPEEAAAVVARYRDEGFSAIKLGWGPLGRSARLDVELVAAARAAGPDIELMIDVGKGWSSIRDGIDRVMAMAEYRPAWIEEPFMPDDYAKYAALARAVAVPLAAGEEETTVADFERLIEAGAVEIIKPDVTRAGGITELMRIAEVARRRGRRCIPHAWSTGIIKAATLHVLAAMPEAEYMEYCVQSTPLNESLVAQEFPVVDGFVRVPDGAGLGVDVDRERLAECLVDATG
jgi:L-rhamnonate dehydratase